tara:strand:+ start:3215 stop:3970 length:756 start_codon:yes stop_codon:yes gene_type:complete
MGSVFKEVGGSAPSAPPAPPPASYIDEVRGVEQVPVKNSDGSTTYVTRALPLSAEEEAKKQQLDKMASDALAEIQRLSSTDYVFSESTTQILDDWQAGQLDALSDSFDDRKQLESDKLAKRGLSDSTAANTIERQTKQDEYDAKKQIDRQKSSIAEGIKSSELSNQYNLYSLAQNQLNYDAAQLQNGINSSLSTVNAINQANQASLNDYYNMQYKYDALNNNSGGNAGVSDSTMQSAIDFGVKGLFNSIMG